MGAVVAKPVGICTLVSHKILCCNNRGSYKVLNFLHEVTRFLTSNLDTYESIPSSLLNHELNLHGQKLKERGN